MWVSHAERPLHIDELCHALGVEEGSIDLNIRNVPAVEALIACCMGLVTVEKSSSTIQLVHYSLQEYLSHNSDFLMPHSMIAEVCLTYLNFRHIRVLSPTLRSVPPTAPFVEHASCYWGIHAGRGNTESGRIHALKLLDGYDKHISSKILLLRGMPPWYQPFDWEGAPREFTGIHGALYFGCVEITAALLETNKWDVQAADFNGNTAIAWAARRGHEGVVNVLLEQIKVNPHPADNEYGRTPLLRAAKSGHKGVVKMLLLEQNDVNPDRTDKWNRTPLARAAKSEYEGVVRMLLKEDDVSTDQADK